MKRLPALFALLLSATALAQTAKPAPSPAAAKAEPPEKEVVIKTTAVAQGISMLEGEGGNIGVSAGEDGVLIIDDQYAPLSVKIKAAIAQLSPKPVRFVVNTHFHGDHTGGNENFGNDGAVIVAHDNVRERLKVASVNGFGESVPASPPKALPIVTYANDLRLHLNGDELRVLHVRNAHTDGDSIVLFEKANVIHGGDTLFFNGYPFIDTSSGGNVNGMIDAEAKILELANDATRIIPGHGLLGGKPEVRELREMLILVRDRVKKLIAKKKSLNDVIDAKVTADLDAKWGHGFLKPEFFVTTVYRSLAK